MEFEIVHKVRKKQKDKKMEKSLPLSEQFYLLGIHPQKGGIISSARTAMSFVLLGSLFLELWLNKNIEFEKKRIVVLNDKSENKLHTFLLNKLKKKERPLKISRWISKLNFSQKYIRSEVQKNLVSKRLIKMEYKKFLFIRWKKPVLLEKSVAFKLIDEIDKQVFSGKVDKEGVLRLSLLKQAGLMKRIFPDKTKRKMAKQRLKKIITDNEVSTAVSGAIAASQAVAASIAVTATVAAASNS